MVRMCKTLSDGHKRVYVMFLCHVHVMATIGCARIGLPKDLVFAVRVYSNLGGRGLTLGSGPNVKLVFKPALNIVYCSWPLLFVNVVQVLFNTETAKIGQNGMFGSKFSLAAWRRRTKWNMKIPFREFF